MATLALPTDHQPSLLDAFEEATAPAAVAADPPAPAAAPAPRAAATPFGQRTLDDVVVGAWEELAVVTATSCPLCAGPLLPRFGAGARPVGARCSSCATELS